MLGGDPLGAVSVAALALFVLQLHSYRRHLVKTLSHRNELVDRLEQAKVAVQERDDAVEEMRLLLLSTQEQLKRNPNLTRAPIAERTWVANEPMIPRIKKSFVSRLITVGTLPDAFARLHHLLLLLLLLTHCLLYSWLSV